MSKASLILPLKNPGSEVGLIPATHYGKKKKVLLSDVDDNIFNCIYSMCHSSCRAFKHILTNHV